MNTPVRLLLALCLAGLAACGAKRETASTAPVAGDAKPSIAWSEGEVDAAFARAGAEGKPVFLYWGAAWCPPCHELKATVFSRPDFIEKLKLFVPVYIDGDAAGAQKWGDEFQVSGYPSVVVLRADRTELARINGGMDLAQYAEVLDLVLGDVRPVAEIMQAMDQQAPLGLDDCRRLVYNGWEFAGTPEEARETSTKLQHAARACPAEAKVERARLTAFSAAAAVDGQQEAIDRGEVPDMQLVAAVQGVHDLLADAPTAIVAADALQYLGVSFFKAAKRALPDQGRQLLQRWSAVMDSAAADPRFAETDQLAAVGMKLRAVKELGGDSIPENVATMARQRVEQSLARGQQGYARAGVVNSALFVLDTLGETDRAFALAEAEMKASQYPYYYMLDLASIEEERGNITQSLGWLERAYRESKGAATRFQWGTEYVMGLVRMQPQEEARIREATLAVLGELDGPDRIHRRTAKRLERLDGALRPWAEAAERKETLRLLRQRRDALCRQIPAQAPDRKGCEAFLSNA